MNDIIYATGKRKRSIARIFIKINGIGKFIINNLNSDDYFKNSLIKKFFINQPINLLNIDSSKFDIFITSKGGGVYGQIFAIRHGIAKALLKLNFEYKNILRDNYLITRDSRKVERKKIGLRKSRKRPQFSKR